MDDRLIEAYRKARYLVKDRDADFQLVLGLTSPDLLRLYRDLDCSTALLITAWNPYSKQLSVEVNCHAQASLGLQLQERAVAVFEAVGRDVSGEWPAESSLLALGLLRSNALELGLTYRQNAIVFAHADAVPNLVLLT